MQKAPVLTLIGIMAAACSSPNLHPSVDTVLRDAERHNGKHVTIQGFLRSRDGFLNLFSKDAEQCVGLLLTTAERAKFSRFVDRKVSIAGTFQAEACGRDGICDEHLCGPGVLTMVSTSAN